MTAVMNDLTPREKVTQRLVGIAALEKLIAQEKAALREEAKEAFTLPGQREVAELNGVTLGNVRLDKPAEGWKVTDTAQFMAWVADHFGWNLVETKTTAVSPAFQREVLDCLEHGRDVVDPISGEVWDGQVPGITYVKGEPRLVVTPSKEAPEAVRAALGESARHLGIRETGDITASPELAA